MRNSVTERVFILSNVQVPKHKEEQAQTYIGRDVKALRIALANTLTEEKKQLNKGIRRNESICLENHK